MAPAPATSWSLVLAARGDDGDARAALAALCAIYRPVVLAYFRRHGEVQHADDQTQSFFLHFLTNSVAEHADRARGSFRAFLFAAIANHAREATRRSAAGKRRVEFSDDESALTAVVDPCADPMRAFDRDWALLVLVRARDRLRDEATRAGKAALFDAVQGFLSETPAAQDYVEIAARFGLRPNSVAVAVKRLRERLRALVRRELADTLAPSVDIDAEVHWLRQALRDA